VEESEHECIGIDIEKKWWLLFTKKGQDDTYGYKVEGAERHCQAEVIDLEKHNQRPPMALLTLWKSKHIHFTGHVF